MLPYKNLLKQTLSPAFFLFCFLSTGCNGKGQDASFSGKTGDLCPLGKATAVNGYQRWALVIGVGQYKNDKIPDLIGPPNDAQRFYELLTSKDGYGFPKENVCLLLNEQATTAKFKETFEKVLVDRAQEKDVAVVYFAGHGSQTRDKNGDEPDRMDETFLFHDSRTNDIGDLVDDEFNVMLAKLYSKTKYITMITDSCNSGTSMRGDKGTFTARFAQPMEQDTKADKNLITDDKGDGGGSWIPESMPGLIAFTAASDGTSALETEGHGIFTDALLQVLSQARDQPLTYAQVARQVPSLIAATSYQIPYFQGELDRPVFGNTVRTRPRGWEVTDAGAQIKLAGTPVAAMGKGAELRVYDGTATGDTTRDPGKAKATLIVDSTSGLSATAHISAASDSAAKIAKGDLALLVRPADAFLKIKVRLRPSNEPGGIVQERTVALRKAIEQDLDAKILVELTEGRGDYELVMTHDNQLQLMGPENKIRNTYVTDAKIPASLWQHARQHALLALQGEGGSLYADNETLQVQLIPAQKQGPCAKGAWEQAVANTEQIIPLCHAWNIRVRLAEKSPTPLLVGGIIASTDGGTYGFPTDGRTVLLKPGEQVVFNSPGETFRGTPPLDLQDRILVFGTQETNPVAWHLLSSPAVSRAMGPKKSPLYKALDAYLAPGSRGVKIEAEAIESSPWTMSSISMRVEANQKFLKQKSEATPIAKREYTVSNFNIAPYMPDNPETALYKVLAKADWLVNASGKDGIGYKQHTWNKPNDEQNLKMGIDCSRFIWFSFTRAGLPYNRSNDYISTADMVGKNSRMNDQFERCDNDQDFKLGDVLVYRDDNQGDGHTVMVIDPIKRIAVGSMAWDGNAKVIPDTLADTGVEYQKIKVKKDMKRWDRSTMELKACWRYRPFIEEAKKPGGQPGAKALTSVCDQANRCGVQN